MHHQAFISPCATPTAPCSHKPCVLHFNPYSTWLSKSGSVGAAVEAALKAGYVRIDCAHIYGNEVEIGEALQKCFKQGVCKREDLFITSKLWLEPTLCPLCMDLLQVVTFGACNVRRVQRSLLLHTHLQWSQSICIISLRMHINVFTCIQCICVLNDTHSLTLFDL